MAGANCSAAEQKRIGARLADLAAAIQTLPSAKARPHLCVLGTRIDIGQSALTVTTASTALARHLSIASQSDPDGLLKQTRPMAIRKRGVETRLVVGDMVTTAPDPTLIGLLIDAHQILAEASSPATKSLRQLARKLGREHRAVARTLPLAFLAADISAAILDGNQPVELTASRLKRFDPDLLEWDAQRRALGFAPAI